MAKPIIEGVAGDASLKTIGQAFLMPVLACVLLALSFVAAFSFEGSTAYEVAVKEGPERLVERLGVTVQRHGIELVGTEKSQNHDLRCGRDATVLHLRSPAYRFSSYEHLQRGIAHSGMEVCSGISMQFQQQSSGPAWMQGWLFLVILIGLSGVLRFLSDRLLRLDKAEPSVISAVGSGLLIAGIILIISGGMWGGNFSSHFLMVNASRLSLLQLMAMSVFVPYLEELGFRAGFISIAERVLPWWLAAVVSAALFALLHGTVLPESLFFYFLAGLLLSLLWQWRKSLLSCVVAHGTYNFVMSLPLLL